MKKFYINLVLLFTYISTVVVIADQGNRIFLIEAIKQGQTDIVSWLIDEEANLDIQDAQGKTPLMYAASLQSVEVVRNLIESGANLEMIDNSGKTAVHYAASSGQSDILDYFYHLDLNITAADFSGKTALHLTSEGGHLDSVIFLLDIGEDPYVTDSENLTSIHIAAGHGHIPILSVFINRSINIDVNDFANGSTPLIFAAMYNETNTSKFLVESGANVNSCNKSLWSTVHAASFSGNINLIDYFLNKNASLEQRDLYGRTPLYIAVERGNLVSAKHLILRGSNLNSTDINGNSLVHAAAKSGNLKLIKYLGSLKLRLDIKNKVGSTPILFACEEGHLDVVKYLLKYQCNINMVNDDGMSAMHAAVISGKTDLVNFLINKGLSLTQKDIMLRTPLHLASMHGHLPVVKLLVETMSHSLNSFNLSYSVAYFKQDCIKCLVTTLNDKDVRGKTCTYIAAESGMLDILKFLMEHGGNHTINDVLGKSPFHAATRRGMVNTLKFLILQNVNINLQDRLGHTPIFDAVEAGQWNSFVFLINIGADPKIKDYIGRTLIHIAAEKGNHNILNLLALNKEMAPLIDAKDKLNRTASWYATRYSHLNCLSSLVSFAATISEDLFEAAIDSGRIETLKYVMWNVGYVNKKTDLQDRLGHTPIFDAVEAGQWDWFSFLKKNESKEQTNQQIHLDSYSKIFKYALSKNSSLDLLTYIFFSGASYSSRSHIVSLLNTVLQSGNTNLMESLMLQEKVNLMDYCPDLLNIQIKRNQSSGFHYLTNNWCKSDQIFPLMNNQTLIRFAASNGDVKALDFLIKHGVDINFRDELNNTALLEAVTHDHVNVVKYLLKNESNAIFLTNNREYFLKLAVISGSLDVVKYFVTSYKHDVNHVYNNGETLLHFAMKSNNALLVTYLIDSGGKINKKNIDGDSPIHIALNYLKSLRVLLEKGADTAMTNNKNETPLQLAYDTGNLAAIKCLLKFGASPYVSNHYYGRSDIVLLLNNVRYRGYSRETLSCEETEDFLEFEEED